MCRASIKSPTNETVIIPVNEIHVDDELQFTKEPIEVLDWKVHTTRRSRIKLVKIRWNYVTDPSIHGNVKIK